NECKTKFCRLMKEFEPFGIYILTRTMIRAIGARLANHKLHILLAWLQDYRSQCNGWFSPSTLVHEIQDHIQPANQSDTRQRNICIVLVMMSQRYHGSQLTNLFTGVA